jgi:signal transduction histidine kinase
MSTEDTTAQIRELAEKRPYQERGRTWWLIPKPFDLVSSSLYLGVMIAFLYSFVNNQSDHLDLWKVPVMICTTLALLAVDRVEYRLYGEETPARVAICLLLVRIIFIEVVAWLDNFDLSPFLYLIVPFLATLYFGSIAGYSLAGLAWVTYIIKHILHSPGWSSNSTEQHYLALFTLGLIFSITLARVVVKEQASRTRAELLLTELEESHEQLKAYAEQAADLATTKERNRLARDIHDSLGHYLTVINVQLEKALAFRDKKPQEADLAVSNAKRLASEALQDVRRSVGTLRASQQAIAFTSAINELVERVRNSQVSVVLHIEGSEEGSSEQALMTLYRAVQEGLTNVQKHAGASSVRITIDFGVSEVHLRLSDNGRGFEPATLGHLQSEREGSYGLLGLRERLELVGGSLAIESRPGKGTTLLASIPKNPLVDNRLVNVQAQEE